MPSLIPARGAHPLAHSTEGCKSHRRAGRPGAGTAGVSSRPGHGYRVGQALAIARGEVDGDPVARSKVAGRTGLGALPHHRLLVDAEGVLPVLVALLARDHEAVLGRALHGSA